MGTIPAPNIVQASNEGAMMLPNSLAEYARAADLQAQTRQRQQQMQQSAMTAPLQYQHQQQQVQVACCHHRPLSTPFTKSIFATPSTSSAPLLLRKASAKNHL